MIGKIIPIVLQIVAVAGGVFGGLALKPKPEPAKVEEHGDDAHGEDGKDKSDKSKDKSHDKKDKKDKGHAKKDKKDKGHGKKGKDGHGEESDPNAAGFIKFGRQFIVPVIEPNGSHYVVVLDLNIEATPSLAQKAYPLEPKLRDALLRVLFQMSNEGALGRDMLVDDNIEDVRHEMLKAVQSILGEEAHDILILNIARQRV